MRFLSLLSQDIRFQIRHGFYHAYLIISFLYILLLYFIPNQEMKELISVIVIFTDPSSLGFFFIGGMILLEKDQQIFDPLFVTPVKVQAYIFSKLISLSLLATATSVLIKTVAFGFTYHFINMFIGVFLTSLFFSLIGINIAAKANSLNHFFLLAMIYTPIFSIPLLSTLQLYDHVAFYLIPMRASLLLIEGSFQSLNLAQYLYSISMLILSIIIAYKIAYKQFHQHIVIRIGG